MGFFKTYVMLKEKLYFIYLLIPFLIGDSIIKNKIGLVLSLLLNKKKFTVKFSSDSILNFESSQQQTLVQLISLLTYSISWNIKSNQVNFSFDNKNYFSLQINPLSYEDRNLLELFYYGIRFGANFISHKIEAQTKYPDKTIIIHQNNKKKIIEVSNGIKFYLDSVLPGVTIVEAFISDIHSVDSKIDWNGKTIVDVGAQCGDTPLYYASKGAKVFAFEPNQNHYNAMLRNLELNPEIAKNITTYPYAIGKDGPVKFFQSDESEITSMSSFVYNVHGSHTKETTVDSFSLNNALKKFNISKVDLLKMDCKGCEFYLDKESLQNVDKIKIEYTAFEKSHKIENLLTLIEKSGFEFFIYRTDPSSRLSNKISGNIYGIRKS